MEYLSIAVDEQQRLLLWLPDHDRVVRMHPESSRVWTAQTPFRDWTGAVVTPEDGERFLEAAFDYLVLQGLTPHWEYVGRCGIDQPDFLEEA